MYSVPIKIVHEFIENYFKYDVLTRFFRIQKGENKIVFIVILFKNH